jgi:hypothetical protein
MRESKDDDGDELFRGKPQAVCCCHRVLKPTNQSIKLAPVSRHDSRALFAEAVRNPARDGPRGSPNAVFMFWYSASCKRKAC